MKRTLSIFLLLTLMLTSLLGVLPAFGATGAPKAPTAVTYRLDTVGGGKADGVVSVTLPSGHGADDIYLYWGNASGKLPGFTALAPFKVSGNVMTHRMAAGTVIPQGATRLLAYSYSDEGGFSTSFASFTLPEGAALTAADLGTLSFEFQSVSDLHITASGATRPYKAVYNTHMKQMLQDIKTNSPNSIGIFNNGDSVDGGHSLEYAEFLKIYNSVSGVPPIYSAFGNHETFAYLDPADFTTCKNAYINNIRKNLPSDTVYAASGSLTYAFWMNGCKFIFIGTDVLNQNWLELNSTSIQFVEDQIKDGRNANRPTFVFMHQPMENTLSATYKGTNSYNASYNGWGQVRAATASSLQAIFKKYPEVIMFNGHTHLDMDEYCTFYPRNGVYPNMFATASVGYLWDAYDLIVGEDLEGSQGYYVYVYGSKIYVRGRDFVNGQWVASAQFMVDLTSEGLATTPKKVVAPPLYGSTASLTASGTTASGSVTCYLPVHHNATAVALYWTSADGGILSSQPFATASVSGSNLSEQVVITIPSATIPSGADYISIYSYSGTLGFSADCDVIDLSTILSGGGAPASGAFSLNKYAFDYGEPVYVTTNTSASGAWIGFRNVASSSATTMNWYYVSNAGTGSANKVNINASSSVLERTFAKLTPGVYEIAWVTGSNFTQKTSENTTTFVVRGGNMSSSGYIKTDRSVYVKGDPIYVTALGGNTADWIGLQVPNYANNNAKLWYYVSVSGMNTAFDITKSSNFSNDGSNDKFATLDVGTYEIAWIDDANGVFKTGKTAENTVTIQIVEAPTVGTFGVPTLTVVKNPVVTALLSQISAADGLVARDYTTASWQTFLTAYNTAKRVRNSDTATQAEVDSAASALETAIAGLVPLNSGAVSSDVSTDASTDIGSDASSSASSSASTSASTSAPTSSTPSASSSSLSTPGTTAPVSVGQGGFIDPMVVLVAVGTVVGLGAVIGVVVYFKKKH